MHELPITESIVRISSEEAEKHNVKKVSGIKIKVGELSGLVPDCIQYYFDILSKGTRIEGAILNIEKIPIRIKCSDCTFEEEFSKVEGSKCPNCGSTNIKRSIANEFYIESMEVEEDGD